MITNNTRALFKGTFLFCKYLMTFEQNDALQTILNVCLNVNDLKYDCCVYMLNSAHNIHWVPLYTRAAAPKKHNIMQQN